jgi:hypothetical protein
MSEQDNFRILGKIENLLHANNDVLYRIEKSLDKERKIAAAILAALTQTLTITGFTDIQEISMVPLAAGQTAIFGTTPIPSTSIPTPGSLVWASSDTINAPVSPNPADPTGLTCLVTFPSGLPAGDSFSLSLTYTNADGTTATQTNGFTTVVAPPPPPSDITGFAPITQVA